MAIKPIDVTNKNFNSKFKGYDKDEVDDFLDQIALEMEKLIQESRTLEKEVKSANEKLSYFSELKDSLNQSIIVAQDTADKLKENAAKESDLTLQQAQAQSEDILAQANKMSDELITSATSKANTILTEASERARQLAVETDDLKKKTRIFHRNLSVLVESQLQIIQSDEWDEILKPFGAYVDNSHQAFREVLEAVEAANQSNLSAKSTENGFEVETETEPKVVEEQQNETPKAQEIVNEDLEQTMVMPKMDKPKRAGRSRI